jgi:YegS/Rv2252/BmrU family lipid kinase
MLRVSVIVNPNAGPARRRRTPREAVTLAEGVIGRLGGEARVLVADGPGAGRELAQQELVRGADVVCAWGGDGTINEVASAVTERGGVLAIVPAGSGNGFARELRIPLRAETALAVAVTGSEHRIDTADFNGRLFFNVAGLGLDAHIAHEFARTAGRQRGIAPYALAGARALFSHEPARYDVVADEVSLSGVPALMVTVANSRQWGNGAKIAPGARLDDGLLDVVVVGETRPLVVASQLWRLLTGTIDRVEGVTILRARHITIAADRDVPAHMDGEPAGDVRAAAITVRAGALRVRVPTPLS